MTGIPSPIGVPTSPSSTAPQGHESRDIKVLLVEDAERTRIALQNILEAHGARVTAAGSAQEAIEAFDTSTPDIIVSDIAMPLEDGHSLIRKIRARGASQGGATPAIALTAFGEPKDRDEALAAGFQEYLTKPVDEGILTSTIGHLVS